MICYNLLWIQEQRTNDIIIKLDSKIVVGYLELGHTVNHCIWPKNVFCPNSMVEYTRRKTNVVTHKLTYTSNPLVLSPFY